MTAKSEVPQLIRNFCVMSTRQFGKPVQSFRTDNGTEFMGLTSYFQEHSILHQTSCVDTPQQNGRVERKHRHILNVARACLFQSHMPVKFWGESVLTATHLINRTPSSMLKNKTPYELLFGRRPSYSMIRTFGCLCYAHLRSRDKDKFGPRSRKCVFVGYPYGKKGWRLFDLTTEKFFVSRDVRFEEEIFPFSHPMSPSSLPIQQPVVVDDDWSTPPVPPTVAVVSPDFSSSPAVGPVLPEEEPLPPSTVVPSPGSPSTSFSSPVDETSETTSPVTPGLPELLGKGQRKKFPSVLHKDFVVPPVHSSSHALAPDLLDSLSSSTVSGTVLYPITTFLSNVGFSANHIAFMAKILDSHEPKHFKDAVKIKKWCEAMRKEIDALEANNTWDVTDLKESYQ
ncbi:PREDICTED: uncharacterized protein LOC104738171 [Camelina sativa]|uniref:Uncharacterized protein LOC104738171 n=1 Tax=Camelina sativa TaxID=90675 RepID=A0ABM0VIG8_CAMSA|nr:PREDICTED: uncharacterized protein LOC104738171 [Camelina sativa]